MRHTRLTRVVFLLLVFTVLSVLPALPALAEPDTDFARARRAADQQNYSQAVELLKHWLLSHPDDTRAQYLLARVYSWQNQFQSSVAIYDSLLADHPNNSDYLLGKAQVLVWQQKAEAALPLLQQARSISPDYQAVWQLELQALRSLDSHQDSGRFDRLLAQAEHRFPGAPWITALRNTSAIEPATEIEGGASYHRLNNGLPSWHEYYVAVQQPTSRNNSVWAQARTVERFDLTDRQLSIAYYHKLNRNWSSAIDADFSSSHDLLPEWSVHGSATRRVAGNWNINGGLQHREYRFVETDILALNIAYYWSRFRASGTVYVTSIDGGTIEQKTESSYLVNVGYYYSSNSHTGLSLAKGNELEYDGSASPLVTDISNISVFGRHWLLNDKWAITYHIERQKQGNLYTRYGFRLGLRYRL